MPVVPVFLNWDKPFLPLARDFLVSEFGKSPEKIELKDVVVVVPGARAGRRLLELLLEAGEASGRIVEPPTIVTVGSFPELLYIAEYPLLNNFERFLLWEQALRDCKDLIFTSLVPESSGKNNFWSGLSEHIQKLYEELASARLNFDQVSALLKKKLGREDRRWDVLQVVLERYLDLLKEKKRIDIHQAREQALQKDVLSAPRAVVLCNLTDLTPLMRTFLQQLKCPVAALLHAPKEYKEFFDECGGVKPEKWAEHQIQIEDEHILFAASPRAQAEAACTYLSKLPKAYHPQDIVLGVLDDQLKPFVQEAFSGFSVREVTGDQLSRAPLLQMLRHVRDYVEQANFESFYELLRDPLVDAWLLNNGNEQHLEAIVAYQEEHLQALYQSQSLLRLESQDPRLDRKVDFLLKTLTQLIGERSSWQEFQALSVWAQKIQNLLLQIYMNRDPQEIPKVVSEILGSMAEDLLSTPITGAHALSLLLKIADKYSLDPQADANAFEILGWLELAMDDAPVVFVLGFNEGTIPGVVGADPFLPDSTRVLLGLTNNQLRYARDCFLSEALYKSRDEVRFFAAQVNLQKDPLLPSRLLYACDATTKANRVLRFFSKDLDLPIQRKLPPALLNEEGQVPQFDIGTIPSISVTGLSDYLKCPYRFYLRHICGLKQPRPWQLEMGADAFGNIVHDVLQMWATSEVQSSTSEQEISEFLNTHLEALFAQRYGPHCLPAVRIQFEQMRARLNSFANWQSEWRQLGWALKHSEYSISGVVLKSKRDDKLLLTLKGRIDRIDYHEESKEWAILDYKTGDEEKSPEQAHRLRKKIWIGLQLPAYQFCVQQIGLCKNPRLGYLNLSASSKKVEPYWTNWNSEEMHEAVELMYEVADRIAQHKFWPPAESRGEYDLYKVLCEAN